MRKIEKREEKKRKGKGRRGRGTASTLEKVFIFEKKREHVTITL